MNKKATKKRIIILAVIAIAMIFSAIGFVNAGTWLVKNDRLTHADAMVILMGEIPDRMLQAADVYKAGYTSQIIMVQSYPGTLKAQKQHGFSISGNTRQCFLWAGSHGIPFSNILLLPGNANSTRDEAIAVRKYLTNIQDTGHPSLVTGHWSLVIVTSPEHTRRASVIFTKALNTRGLKTVVMTSPSKYSAFTGQGWWKDRAGRKLVLSEYAKIVHFLLIGQFNL